MLDVFGSVSLPEEDGCVGRWVGRVVGGSTSVASGAGLSSGSVSVVGSAVDSSF